MIALAKECSDEIDRQWQNVTILDPQTVGENEMLRKANSELDLASAQKSVLIDELKRVLGEAAYDEIRERVVKSDQFKSLTLHANVEN